ncbi:glucose-6-phosphate isomerase [Paenimyroides aestuarii]|uniref:Glucose-6-phosphate isomerase n=1 Tax=Paenimyroides aestuarii TaxID=2968490 RepID=A0ABY5NUY2_9FLAO|nr:glucose-6-phosphate isomerase [Paenimyroides aestuarii]UUV22212.1 glucose-6-phosphate isomerase [Paenimyroides aestuarii]
MPLLKINPTETQAWQKLRQHFYEVQFVKMQQLFAENPNRINEFHIVWNDFLIDFSKNRITNTTIDLLTELADEVQLKAGIEALIKGETINETEGRKVLHTDLRQLTNNQNQEVAAALDQIQLFTENVIKGHLKGSTGLPFTDVINIGIGGSDLGPKLVTEALTDYKNHLNVHYISNIDNDSIQSLKNKLNPATTLVVIVSKSFTTLETISNANIFKQWLLQNNLKTQDHLVAVSSNIPEAVNYGIETQNIFPMWDYVGGRYSLWSAVGVSTALAIGFNHFKELLNGAHEMDVHFAQTPFKQNIPVVLALLSVWYNNFFCFETEAVVPYVDKLKMLPAYLQQVVMESNGKSVDRGGNPVNYETGTIVWGEVGTNSQHAFFQLFHQGTKIIPTDFIGFVNAFNPSDLHDLLMANFFAQTEALMNGKEGKYHTEATNDKNAVYKEFKGNRPSNTILIDQLTPKSLGSLLAMYEHKTFVQGYIWNIYSFDQFGVEYGKVLANNIKAELQSEQIKQHDCSTTFLLKHYLKKKQ